jgi:hypothetical protein
VAIAPDLSVDGPAPASWTGFPPPRPSGFRDGPTMFPAGTPPKARHGQRPGFVQVRSTIDSPRRATNVLDDPLLTSRRCSSAAHSVTSRPLRLVLRKPHAVACALKSLRTRDVWVRRRITHAASPSKNEAYSACPMLGAHRPLPQPCPPMCRHEAPSPFDHGAGRTPLISGPEHGDRVLQVPGASRRVGYTIRLDRHCQTDPLLR